MRPIRLSVAASAAALLLVPAARAAEPDACGGVTQVNRVCLFTYQGGQISYHVQNVRVILPGILRDDSVRLEVFNVSQQRVIATCDAVTIAAGCGALRGAGGSVVGDTLRCTAVGLGSVVVTVFSCTSTRVS